MCLLTLTACLQQAQLIVPEALTEQLEGQWQEVNLPDNQLTFYADETVKVVMPAHKPPMKLLTHLEAVNDGVVLSFGDRWERPAMVSYDPNNDSLVLGFYAEDSKSVTDRFFQRVHK